MEKTALAAAFALSLCAAGAQAQYAVAPVPTVDQAHQHLAFMFAKYQVKYLVWYGPGTHDYYRGYGAYYSGSGCTSEFGNDPVTRAFGVDWSKISQVRDVGTGIVYVGGELVRASSGRQLRGFHLYLADTRSGRSVANALEVLQTACAQRTIFDVASR